LKIFHFWWNFDANIYLLKHILAKQTRDDAQQQHLLVTIVSEMRKQLLLGIDVPVRDANVQTPNDDASMKQHESDAQHLPSSPDSQKIAAGLP
jgi:hypothetical protein